MKIEETDEYRIYDGRVWVHKTALLMEGVRFAGQGRIDIAANAVIEKNVVITGKCWIGEKVRLGSSIESATIMSETVVGFHCTIIDCVIGRRCHIASFVSLTGAILGDCCFFREKTRAHGAGVAAYCLVDYGAALEGSKLGMRCWVGKDAVVGLVELPPNAVIAEGAVIRESDEWATVVSCESPVTAVFGGSTFRAPNRGLCCKLNIKVS